MAPLFWLQILDVVDLLLGGVVVEATCQTQAESSSRATHRISTLPPDHFLISSIISLHAFSSRKSLAYSSTLVLGATFLMYSATSLASRSSAGW